MCRGNSIYYQTLKHFMTTPDPAERMGTLKWIKNEIVLPQHFSLLHFLSFMDDPQALKHALDLGISYTMDF